MAAGSCWRRCTAWRWARGLAGPSCCGTCGAPLGLAVVAAVAAPSLFVRLALIDAPLQPAQMVAAISRGTFAAGLVLAGLAPAAALLVVSIESARAAAWMSGLGLWLSPFIGRPSQAEVPFLRHKESSFADAVYTSAFSSFGIFKRGSRFEHRRLGEEYRR